jgi:hypothetical protein
MRSSIMACGVAGMVLLAAGFASAATPGQIPQSRLASLGLAGLQTMSDNAGLAIRGSGYIYGSSSASLTGNPSSYGKNGYGTSVSPGQGAAGTNNSYAGLNTTTTTGMHGTSTTATGFAGGSSTLGIAGITSITLPTIPSHRW